MQGTDFASAIQLIELLQRGLLFAATVLEASVRSLTTLMPGALFVGHAAGAVAAIDWDTTLLPDST